MRLGHDGGPWLIELHAFYDDRAVTHTVSFERILDCSPELAAEIVWS